MQANMAVTDTLTLSLPDTRLTTEKFPLKDRSLHLSVEIREKEVLACLLDKRQNRYIAWATYPFNLKDNSLDKLLKEDFFATELAGLSVVFTSNSPILLPAQFFKKELMQDYLKFQQLDKADETACAHYIKNLDSQNVYTVNSELLTRIKTAFPGASFRHHSSIFIEYTLMENKSLHEDKVYVNVFSKYMDVVVLKAGKLILSNRFYYENNSDFMYYLLWV